MKKINMKKEKVVEMEDMKWNNICIIRVPEVECGRGYLKA